MTRPAGTANGGLVCAAAGALLGGACLLAQGPLPGDVALTRALQALLGTAPGWAAALTETAKPPWLWATLLLAMALGARRGWRGGLAAALALAVAMGLDLALRAVLFAPRPAVELVAVAAPSTSSGLPSTFGLVYGALFGAAACDLAARAGAARAAGLLALALLLAGGTARVVLGGHWGSQIAASLLLGVAIALTAALALRAPPGATGPAARAA